MTQVLLHGENIGAAKSSPLALEAKNKEKDLMMPYDVTSATM